MQLLFKSGSDQDEFGPENRRFRLEEIFHARKYTRQLGLFIRQRQKIIGL
jgi:hypothetical protein